MHLETEDIIYEIIWHITYLPHHVQRTGLFGFLADLAYRSKSHIYNHALSVVHRLCTPLLATDFNLETLHLVLMCTCTPNIRA